ncbi:glucosamine-6-phosphate deaminase [Neobacillus mesonae]|nr:glucosamine-6-phosphate deaminase [Neobacillus mesonae]
MAETAITPVYQKQADQLKVNVYQTREEMGKAAASDAIQALRSRLHLQERVRVVFAAAPSQNEFLKSLMEASSDVEWSKVEAFHMDEYIGLSREAEQSFARFVEERVVRGAEFKDWYPLNGTAETAEECRRYEKLLREAPIDFVFMGIGENGHIAFNDPPVADFADKVWVKPVELDEACRQQQVNDGCFPSFEEVPTHALTLTVPALMSGSELFCIVPGFAKRQAVFNTVHGPVSEICPASILRTHPNCRLYTDIAAWGELAGK